MALDERRRLIATFDAAMTQAHDTLAKYLDLSAASNQLSQGSQDF